MCRWFGPDHAQPRRIVEVDVTIRSPFVIRRDVLQSLGLFDEAYAPLGYDDHAYCMRARKLGFRVCTRLVAQQSRYGGGSSWLYEDQAKAKFFRDSFDKNIRLFVEEIGTSLRPRPPWRLREFR